MSGGGRGVIEMNDRSESGGNSSEGDGNTTEGFGLFGKELEEVHGLGCMDIVMD